MTTPVLLIAFNRPETTRAVFAKIRQARPPRLYLASDGARQGRPGETEIVAGLRKWLVDNVDWPCRVFTRFNGENLGCGRGVASAVTWFFECEAEGIVLEDDCDPHPDFFTYCEALLDRYRGDLRVWHIAGFNPLTRLDVDDSYCFVSTMQCWGWASWADRWRHFSLSVDDLTPESLEAMFPTRMERKFWGRILEGRKSPQALDTWDYQWQLRIAANQGLCAIPRTNLVQNIGDEGTHATGAPSSSLRRPTATVLPLRHPAAVIHSAAVSHAIVAPQARALHLHRRALSFVTRTVFRLPWKRPKRPASGVGLDVALAIGVGIVAFLYVFLFRWKSMDWGGDFSQYIAQAAAWVDGDLQTFVDRNTWTIDNTDFLLGPYLYPWGESLALAPIYAAIGFHLEGFKLPSMVFHAFFLPLFFLVCRSGLSRPAALCATGFLLLSPPVVQAAQSIGSDVLYLGFSFSSVLLFGALHTGRPFRHPLRVGLFATLLAWLAFTSRTNGVCIPLTMVCVWALLAMKTGGVSWSVTSWLAGPLRDPFAKHSRFVHLALLSVFVLATLALSSLLGVGGSGHAKHLQDLSPRMVFGNVALAGAALGEYFGTLLPLHTGLGRVDAVFYNPFGIVLLAASAPLVVLGLRRRFNPVHLIFVLGSTLAIFLWPAMQGPRFLLFLIPFLVLWFSAGACDVLARPGTWRKRGVQILLACVFGSLLLANVRHVGAVIRAEGRRPVAEDSFSPSARALYDFIRRGTPDAAAFAFFKPRVLALATGRACFGATRPENLAKADYLVSSVAQHDTVAPAVAAFLQSHRGEPVFHNDCFTVFRLVK